jgi:pyruvate/2-oxoglutarate dehydrogenase complex dihydrolipoamide dehydrogenase (E3) component
MSTRRIVVPAADVLESKVNADENVAVIGGEMIGCETANHLAHHGKKSTIIEVLSDLAPEEPRDIERFLMQSLKEREVAIYTDSTVTAVSANGSITISQKGQGLTLTGFESVVLAGGMQSVNSLKDELEGSVDSIQVIGDAIAVRTLLEAIEEGYEAALKI